MKRVLWLVVALTASAVLLAFVMAAGFLALFAAPQASTQQACGGGGVAIAGGGGFTAPSWWDVDGKGAERQANAATIVRVGRSLGVSDRAIAIAVATAIQESKLVNLDGGDRDSRGLFQQRPSQGWGTVAQVTDPTYAATRFFAALQAVQGWDSMPLTDAAQAVQRSAFPDAYAQWEQLATELVTASAGAGSVSAGPPAAAGAPAQVGQYSGVQLRNAATIIAVGRSLGLDERDIAIAIMTALGESDLGADASSMRPNGDKDSGLFQLRVKIGWHADGHSEAENLAMVNDSTYAARVFFLGHTVGIPGGENPVGEHIPGLIDVPERAALEPTIAAHRVQGNTDAYHYTKWWPAAQELYAALQGSAPAASVTTTACTAPSLVSAGSLVGSGPPPGGWPAESCSVPDPTDTGGCVTPRTAAIATQLMSSGYSLTCWDAHAWNPRSDHPRGKACDVYFGPGGKFAKGADKARGDALYAALQQNADQLGVKYLIWYGKYWSAKTKTETPYGGGGVYNAASATGGHYDHVHVSMH